MTGREKFFDAEFVDGKLCQRGKSDMEIVCGIVVSGLAAWKFLYELDQIADHCANRMFG